MSAARELAQLLQDVTTRAEQGPGSRNRPINLYATNYETLVLTEDTAAATATTPSDLRWWDGSGPASEHGYWGQAEWRSS